MGVGMGCKIRMAGAVMSLGILCGAGLPAAAGGPTIRAMPWKQDRACVLAVYAAEVSKPVRNFGNRVRISGKCPDDFVQGRINKAGNEITMGGVTYVVAPGATSGTPK